MFDTCFPSRKVRSNHYIIPRPPTKTAFGHDSGLREPLLTSFPEEPVLQELLQCYFQYVHPFLPIVDANDFLSTIDSPQRRSPLLKWSMLFAGASVSRSVTKLCQANQTQYISNNGLKRANYVSRKIMKRAMYRQAKV